MAKHRPPRRKPPAGRSSRSANGRKSEATPRVVIIAVWIVWAIPLAALFLLGASVGLAMSAMPELPQLEKEAATRKVESVIFARDNKTVLRRVGGGGSRRYINEAAVPDSLQQAVVAAEDRRFYEHSGVDIRGIGRAAWVDLRARSAREGGSTITQQLIKNAYLGPDRALARKTREAALAWALETRWSKQRILTAYLNAAYFGQGQYGIANAAKYYCQSTVPDVSISQAAMLAGILPAPEIRNPSASRDSARVARNTVLRTMRDLDQITDAQLRASLAEPVCTPKARAARTELAPHFTDDVVGTLSTRYGQAQVLRGGLRVKTTIDPRTQKAALSASRMIEGTGLSTAIVAIDPRNGEVRASVSASSRAQRSLDLVRLAQRQPGSAFKPFVLASAYERGVPPTARLESSPYARRLDDGTRYRVTNDGGYSGSTTVQAATWKSDNTAFVRLADQIGRRRIIRLARSAGLTSTMDDLPSLPLGALPKGVTPLELAHAYATLAMHGSRRGDGNGAPISVTSVRMSDGITDTTRSRKRAISRGAADLTTKTLQGVIQQGTGTGANPGRAAAGKTGTTELNADAWFAGYTPELVVVVWVGHPEGAVPMRTEFNGGPVYGGTWPAMIWKETVETALENVPPRSFNLEVPKTMSVRVDPNSGKLAGEGCSAKVVQVLSGFEPKIREASCDTSQDNHSPTNAESATPTDQQGAVSDVVPDVIGMNVHDARSALEALGLTVTFREIRGTSAELGVVAMQSDLPGTVINNERRQIAIDVVTSSPGGGSYDLP